MTVLGMKQIPEEPCIFTNDWLIVFFYVDDIALVYYPHDKERADDFIKKLQE